MSNTPTPSAQVAEGLSMEAERAEFESVMLSQFGEGETFKRDKYGCYMNRSWHDAFIGWRAARRTAATGADSLPPLPPIDEHWMTNDHTYTAEQVRQAQRDAIAPYAERIRQLERELVTFKGEHATQLATKSIDSPEFREMLRDYRGTTGLIVAMRNLNNIIAYIDGRTAGPAVPDWQPIETAPQDKMLLLAAEFDGPGDWRIKVGGFWDRKWNVFGATWTPTSWMPLPAAPKPQEDA